MTTGVKCVRSPLLEQVVGVPLVPRSDVSRPNVMSIDPEGRNAVGVELGYEPMNFPWVADSSQSMRI